MSNAQELAFSVHGPDDAPPLVFLHGFMGRKEDWAPVVERLGDRFHCFCFDLPFHGESKDIYADFDDTIQMILRRLDAFWCRRFGIVGYSMGGRIALQLTLHHTERVNKCVLESASPGIWIAHAREERRLDDEALAEDLEQATGADEAVLEAFLRRWYSAALWESLRRDAERLEHIIAMRKSHNAPRALASALRTLGTGRQNSQWDALMRNQTPLLCIFGEMDTKYCQIAREMEMRAPLIQLAPVANCGHNVHLEQPGEYAEALLNFFSQ